MLTRRRAFIIPMLLILIPIIVLTVFTLVQMSVVENGFALHQSQDRKLAYLAEAGLNVAWYAFAASNFSLATHQPDGTSPVTGWMLLPVSVPGITYDGASGWYRWQWSPGDPPDQSYSGEGVAESYKFQVYFPAPGQWRIVCQSSLGNHSQRWQTQGFTTSAFRYALYANGDVADLSRYQSSTVTGQVQVNGSAWFCPMVTGTTLSLQSDTIGLGGKAYRFEDIWGRPDGGGDVTIAKGGQGGPPVLMDGASQGVHGQGQEYDSFFPTWTTGVVSKYGGVLVDENLGGPVRDAPSAAFAAGGYYDRTAELHVSATSGHPWLSPETFLNPDTGQTVTAARVDLAALAMSSDWPGNGILYASLPIALVHGETLRGPLSVVSNSTIYVHGSYNRKFGNLVAQLLYILLGLSSRQPAAIMTSDRIFFMSDAWSDAASLAGGPMNGAVWPLFPADLNALLTQVWELNAGLVDGAPAVDMRAYVPAWNGVANPYYHPAGDPHTDGFMETGLTGITASRLGAVIHLENATMASFDNSNAGPGVTPWMVTNAYTDPQRDYRWDPTLLSDSPPGAPQVATRVVRQRIGP